MAHSHLRLVRDAALLLLLLQRLYTAPLVELDSVEAKVGPRSRSRLRTRGDAVTRRLDRAQRKAFMPQASRWRAASVLAAAAAAAVSGHNVIDETAATTTDRHIEATRWISR